MKCFAHLNVDAVAVCSYCGQAVCPACVAKTPSGRVICSSACSREIQRLDQITSRAGYRSATSLRTTGTFSLAAGLVFGSTGFFELYNGIARLGCFLLPLALVFIIVGVAYLRIAGKKERNDDPRH